MKTFSDRYKFINFPPNKSFFSAKTITGKYKFCFFSFLFGMTYNSPVPSVVISRKREAQNEFLKHIRSTIPGDNKMDDLLNWERKDEILDWLDSL